eukprot:gene3049-3511_t
MKNHKRHLKLPAIGEGTLFETANRRDAARSDLYDSLTIEHESSSESCSSSDDDIDEYSSSSTSLSHSTLEEQSQVRGGRLKSLKAVANAIVAQRCWAKTVMKRWQKQRESALNAVEKKEESNSITFNPNAFKAHIQACGRLSEEIKITLQKYSGHRTAEEVEAVGKLVRRLRCLDRYSPAVKKELGKILYYDSFEDGRLVIQQGQLGISFYFIVSGTVVVERIEIDKKTGSRHIQRVDELGPGYSFGELALLHSNTKRAASMICKGHCEFLRIDRGDFGDVLQMLREKEWDIKADIINDLEIFSDYSSKDKAILNGNAKTETYWANTVIAGGQNCVASDRIYVITSGVCNVIKQLVVVKRWLSNNTCKYVLPSESFLEDIELGGRKWHSAVGDATNTDGTVEIHSLVINQLGVGDVFDIGEDQRDLLYISDRKVSVIQIAKVAFTRQLESGKSFEKIKRRCSFEMPSREEIFNKFIVDVNWRKFKRKIARQAVSQANHKQISAPCSYY